MSGVMIILIGKYIPRLIFLSFFKKRKKIIVITYIYIYMYAATVPSILASINAARKRKKRK